MQNIYLKLVSGVAFVANGLPINNRSTGEISDAYPNLFPSVVVGVW